MNHRLYHDLAYLFPVITPKEHYRNEAAQWSTILRQALGEGSHRILELGVGGGHLLSYLRDDFEATAVDISEEMLALSGKLNPSVRHIHGDMRYLNLNEQFRAVIIHDAVSYLTSEEDLQATVAVAYRHLEKNGVLVISPDYLQETFISNRVTSFTNQLDDMTVTFLEHTWDPDSQDNEIEVNMFFLIMQGKTLRVEEDTHRLGLFSRTTWDRILTGCGFSAEWIPSLQQEEGMAGYLIVCKHSS